MAGVMVLLALMLIFSTVIFQSWEEVLRRDNEAEMMFRAQDIVRAIQRYKLDRGTTPMKLEDLIEPGQRGQYFLRKLYTDPLVPDGLWGLLYAGPGGELIDPNVETIVGGELPLDQFGSAALSGDTTDLSRAERRELARRRAAARNRRKIDPRRTGEDPFAARSAAGALGSLESQMAGGKQLAGLQISGVKSLCEDDPFRVYKGHMQYTKWLFSLIDLEQPQLGGPRGAPGAVQAGQQPGGLGGRSGAFPGATRGNSGRGGANSRPKGSGRRGR